MPGLQDLLSGFGMNQNQLYGQDAGYLSQTLKDRAGAGLGNTLTEALNLGRGNIARGVGENFDRIDDRIAGRGISGANFFTDAMRAGGDANAQLTSNIAGLGEQQNQNALGLLGQHNAQQSQAGQNIFGGLLQNKQFVSQLLQQNDQFLADLGFKREQLEEMARQFDESQPGALDIFGNVVSSFATGAGAAAGFALSDRRLKENIHKTGEKTKEGIPVITFNYKADPFKIKHTGVLAQDVEKVKPRAVVKAVDYSKLNRS